MRPELTKLLFLSFGAIFFLSLYDTLNVAQIARSKA